MLVQHAADSPALRAAIFLFLSLAGCASHSAPPPESVLLAPEVRLELPSPSALGRRIDAAQRITARYRGTLSVFECRIGIDAGELLLVCIDGLGRRAMTIDWNGKRLDVEKAAWLPGDLPPENILADIVLLYWPPEIVRRALHGANLVSTPQRLTVRHDDADIVVITHDADPWNGAAVLSNRARDYEIAVSSQELP